MIDTDKYEGHSVFSAIQTVDGWRVSPGGGRHSKVNAQLIADAPLLLAEVKRLREENDMLAEAVKGDNEILKKHIETLAEVKNLRRMADELIAIWEILEEDYPHVDRAIVKELIERKIGDYEVIE